MKAMLYLISMAAAFAVLALMGFGAPIASAQTLDSIVSTQLEKVCADLDELYGAYMGTTSKSATKAETETAAAAWVNFDLTDHFRKTVQFNEINDTIWVKVVVTISASDATEAKALLVEKGLRRVTQFGTLVTGQIPLQNLPQLDQMQLVERIEPVTPSAYTARTSVTSIDVVPDHLSKKN